MHYLTLRQRSSKIYLGRRTYNIPMNNDRSHIHMNNQKAEETKVVQERRQIDKIMHGIIKERLFSNFIEEETRISEDIFTKINGICKKAFFGNRFKKRARETMHISKTIDVNLPKQPATSRKTVNFNNTIQCFSSSKEAHSIQRANDQPKRSYQSQARQRRQSLRFPDLQRADTAKTAKIRTSHAITAHPKKLDFNEKAFHETFRKWGGISGQTLVNEIKITKETIISKLKNQIQPSILQRFFHFFSFPQQFSLRQYATLVQNAANCSLRFIYFWLFIVMDDNSNGVLTMQQLFKFLQRFPDNVYIEKQLFVFAHHIKLIEQGKNKADIQIPVEESLTVNRNLKMEELNVILKKSTKERIDVSCVRNTFYHLTILSLQHDPHQRAKLNQIESNEEVTKMMKLKRKDEKQKLQSMPGIRLRDFYHIFQGKRPKIFCYVLHLLAGVPPSDYE